MKILYQDKHIIVVNKSEADPCVGICRKRGCPYPVLMLCAVFARGVDPLLVLLQNRFDPYPYFDPYGGKSHRNSDFEVILCPE